MVEVQDKLRAAKERLEKLLCLRGQSIAWAIQFALGMRNLVS